VGRQLERRGGTGQLDAVEGVARDSAVVDGFVQARASERSLPFAIIGQSMGGGAGTLLEQTLAQRGAFGAVVGSHAGAPIAAPRGAPPIVALAPYVEYTPTKLNRIFATLGRTPIVGEIDADHPRPALQPELADGPADPRGARRPW
jgi:alpha-beta hydrolase superfamily lysophospholipase